MIVGELMLRLVGGGVECWRVGLVEVGGGLGGWAKCLALGILMYVLLVRGGGGGGVGGAS